MLCSLWHLKIHTIHISLKTLYSNILVLHVFANQFSFSSVCMFKCHDILVEILKDRKVGEGGQLESRETQPPVCVVFVVCACVCMCSYASVCKCV